jgi:hypothetical protein
MRLFLRLVFSAFLLCILSADLSAGAAAETWAIQNDYQQTAACACIRHPKGSWKTEAACKKSMLGMASCKPGARTRWESVGVK